MRCKNCGYYSDGPATDDEPKGIYWCVFCGKWILKDALEFGTDLEPESEPNEDEEGEKK